MHPVTKTISGPPPYFVFCTFCILCERKVVVPVCRETTGVSIHPDLPWKPCLVHSASYAQEIFVYGVRIVYGVRTYVLRITQSNVQPHERKKVLQDF